MPITCNYLDASDVDVPGPFYNMDEEVDYKTAPVLRRRKRCASCDIKINPGSTCTSHSRFTFPRSEVEARIVGGGYEDWEVEIPLASVWLCEKCSDLYFSFLEKGFAVFPHEDMNLMLDDYQDYVRSEGKTSCSEENDHAV